MDKRESLVGEWIIKAEHDLGMAELAIANKPEAHQAALKIKEFINEKMN